jgi:hypothetical protein
MPAGKNYIPRAHQVAILADPRMKSKSRTGKSEDSTAEGAGFDRIVERRKKSGIRIPTGLISI